MAYDIGPKIGIEGEAEYRKQISQINTGLSVLKTEMNAVTSAFDKNDKSEEALTAQNEVLNKQIDAQKQKLEQLTKGLEASREKYGDNDEVTMKWQRSINQATADLNVMERELSGNTAALDMGAKAGINWAGAGGKVLTAAKVAAKAIAAVSAAAIGAATAIGGLVYKSAEAADEINTLSKQTGLSTDEIQKFQFASEQIDVSMDTLTGSLSKLTKNMATARKGTGDAAKAFKTLGVSIVDDVTGELRNNSDVFYEAIDALGDVENETERDALAMAMFGKSAQDLNPLILGGADALKELGQQAEDAGLILSQDSLDKLNSVADAVDTFKASMKGAGRLFSTAFAQPIADAVNTVTGWIGRLSKAFNEGGFNGLGDELAKVMSEALNKLTENLPKLVDVGMQFLGKLIEGIALNLPQIGLAMLKVGVVIVEALGKTFANLIIIGGEMIKNLGDGIKEKLKTLGGNILTGIWNGISDKIAWLKEKVTGVIDTIKGWFTGKKGFDTHSPSLWGGKLGSNVAAGVEGSMLSGLENLRKNIGKSVEDIKSSFDPLSGLQANVAYATGPSQTAGQTGTQSTIDHAIHGTVRIEGVNNKNEFVEASEVVIEEMLANIMRRQRRLA